MRTKKHAIEKKELVPVYVIRKGDDVMKDGVNLRGGASEEMFKRNFKRSRLGNAALEALEEDERK